ncbi:hypothetical protein, partial [Oceanobacillus luteolus]
TVNLFKTSQIHGYLAFLFLILVASIIKFLSSGLHYTHFFLKIPLVSLGNMEVHSSKKDRHYTIPIFLFISLGTSLD